MLALITLILSLLTTAPTHAIPTPCAQVAHELYLTGDFTGGMRPALGEEDSAAVDAVLSAREAGTPEPNVC